MHSLIQRFQPKLSQIIVFGLVVTSGLFISPAAAQSNSLGLREQGRYDLYFASHHGLNMIRNVEIADLRTIEGRLFIVLETDAFATQRSEALIAFDAIQAVIPTENGLRVEAAPPGGGGR